MKSQYRLILQVKIYTEMKFASYQIITFTCTLYTIDFVVE